MELINNPLLPGISLLITGRWEFIRYGAAPVTYGRQVNFYRNVPNAIME